MKMTTADMATPPAPFRFNALHAPHHRFDVSKYFRSRLQTGKEAPGSGANLQTSS
jgi:hypothetical protein